MAPKAGTPFARMRGGVARISAAQVRPWKSRREAKRRKDRLRRRQLVFRYGEQMAGRRSVWGRWEPCELWIKGLFRDFNSGRCRSLLLVASSATSELRVAYLCTTGAVRNGV